MGAHAAKAGLPPELPVMAALTESGLRNLNYGDRDSVGFFQMRTGIWNEGPYTGYATNPELQIQWFIDHALAVKAQYPGLAENPSSWGELVANVEQPAAEYRYRYQLQLGMAQQLLHGADLTPPPPAPPIPLGQAALKVALAQLQNPGRGRAHPRAWTARAWCRWPSRTRACNCPAWPSSSSTSACRSAGATSSSATPCSSRIRPAPWARLGSTWAADAS